MPRRRKQITAMMLPTAPVTLTVEQVGELNGKLSKMRHDVSGELTIVCLALDVMKKDPSQGAKLAAMVSGRVPKISQLVGEFSRDFETMMGITRTDG
jgi:hypothetical protein